MTMILGERRREGRKEGRKEGRQEGRKGRDRNANAKIV